MFAIQIITCGKGEIKREEQRREEVELRKVEWEKIVSRDYGRKKLKKEWLHFYMTLIKKNYTSIKHVNILVMGTLIECPNKSNSEFIWSLQE